MVKSKTSTFHPFRFPVSPEPSRVGSTIGERRKILQQGGELAPTPSTPQRVEDQFKRVASENGLGKFAANDTYKKGLRRFGQMPAFKHAASERLEKGFTSHTRPNDALLLTVLDRARKLS